MTQRTLVVYYSLDGHCQLIAEHLAKTFAFDVLRLKPEQDLNPDSMSKHVVGRWQVLSNGDVRLKEYETDPLSYQNVIIGSPVWLHQACSAISSFVNGVAFKDQNIALYCTYDKDAGRFFEKMHEALGQVKIIGEEAFKVTESDQEALLVKADLWVRSLLDSLNG